MSYSIRLEQKRSMLADCPRTRFYFLAHLSRDGSPVDFVAVWTDVDDRVIRTGYLSVMGDEFAELEGTVYGVARRAVDGLDGTLPLPHDWRHLTGGA